MAEGQVRCVGSSMFLKRRYGVGYILTIVKRPSCDTAVLTALIARYVPEVKVATNIGAELSLRLPLEASAVFEAMFAAVDAQSEALGVQSYGISVTTIEDVSAGWWGLGGVGRGGGGRGGCVATGAGVVRHAGRRSCVDRARCCASLAPRCTSRAPAPTGCALSHRLHHPQSPTCAPCFPLMSCQPITTTLPPPPTHGSACRCS
jgi:hypothetical protein